MRTLATILILLVASAASADTITITVTTGATGDPATETTVEDVTLTLPAGAASQIADSFGAIYPQPETGQVDKWKWFCARLRKYMIEVTKQHAAEVAQAAVKTAVSDIDQIDTQIEVRPRGTLPGRGGGRGNP